jgi:predicted acylesterase/phospholipase RssA
MPDIGIVLAGGFAKGAYQVGVLQALDEVLASSTADTLTSGEKSNCRLYISAASIGAVNACAYVMNRLDHAEKGWLGFNVKSTRSLLKILRSQTHISSILEAFVGEKDFAIRRDLYVTCFNTSKVLLEYVNLRKVEPKRIKKYLRAGIAVPIFSKPVEIGGNNYLDGAMIDNIPISPLMKHHLDYIIVVHFDKNSYSFENEYFDNKLIKINFMDSQIIKSSFAFDRESISFMMKAGYEHSKAIFEIVFKNGVDDLDYIYKQTSFLNSLQNERQLRITGDVVVNNINKILKKIL